MRVRVETKVSINAGAIRQINNGTKQAVIDLFEQIYQDAKELSPVDTGANRDSIGVRVKSRGNLIFARIFTRSGHGRYLETGTAKMDARPYLHPAFERAMSRMQEIMRTRLQQFAQLDQIIADFGIEGVKAAMKARKWNPRKKKAKA